MGGAPPPPLGFAPQGGPEAALFGAPPGPPAETPRGSTPSRGGGGSPLDVGTLAADPRPGTRRRGVEGDHDEPLGEEWHPGDPRTGMILAGAACASLGSPPASPTGLAVNTPAAVQKPRGGGGVEKFRTPRVSAGVLTSALGPDNPGAGGGADPDRREGERHHQGCGSPHSAPAGGRPPAAVQAATRGSGGAPRRCDITRPHGHAHGGPGVPPGHTGDADNLPRTPGGTPGHTPHPPHPMPEGGGLDRGAPGTPGGPPGHPRVHIFLGI